MTKKMEIGCARPKISKSSEEVVTEEKTIIKKEEKNMIKVGKPAPQFTAPAYHNGEFTEVSLEDFKGQWVLLCFYPGDFTFV